MKKIYILLSCWLLCYAHLIWAAGKPEADTFLWKANKTGRPTVYLLGTIHMGKVGSQLPAAYRQVLQESAQLIVESDSDELELPQYAVEAQQLANMITDTRTLNQSIGKVRLYALNRILARGQDLLSFEGNAKQTPWSVWIAIQTLYLPKGYSAQYGVDNLLLQQAKQQGKTIIPLERLQPLYLLQNIPEDKIIRSLDSLLIQHRAIFTEQKKLLQLYHNQQAKALWQEVSQPTKFLRFTPKQDHAYWQDFMLNKLLVQRNQIWMMQLVTILPHNTTLVAVGAAHLFGEQGLIRKMRQLGYQVVPVY